MAVTGYKIYVTGNIAYIDEIVDSGSAMQFEGLAKNCLPRKKYTNSTEFSFTGFNGLSETQLFPIAMLKDGNGDAWADQATFEAWATSNLGKPSAGDSALTDYGPAQRGAFNGEFKLDRKGPNYFYHLVQSAPLVLSVGPDAIAGGIDKVKVTANGSGISGFSAWKNLGGDTIPTTNGAVFVMVVDYYEVSEGVFEPHYTVKVL